MIGSVKAARLSKLIRRALVTSCTGDEGRKAMNHVALGLIFRVTLGLSIIDNVVD
jgi:hypothetical protein